MRKFLAAMAALGVVAGISTAARANIVYAINQSSTTPEVTGENSPLYDTVSGTITTNGTTGALPTSDIVSWNLALTDHENAAYDVDLTPLNSGIWNVSADDGLTASATGLSFNFSDAGAVFIIQGTTYGFSSGFQYFCFQANGGPCINGETIVPYYYAVDGVAATGFSGTTPLSGAPEPAIWAMLLLGVAGLGVALRARRRPATVSA